MKILKLLSIIFLLILFNKGYSQDKIYVKGSNDVINAEIIEIGTGSVRYKPYNDPESPILNMDKQLILKVITKNGDTYTFGSNAIDNPALYSDQRKNALKFGFLNPFVGSTQISFEHSLEPGRSIEFTLGIIGAGIDVQDDNAFGATFKFGYKFIKKPDFLIPGMTIAHILNGGYVRPEIILNVYGYDGYSYDYYGSYNSYTRQTSFSGAIVLNLGKQWVFDNAFLIDFYVGVGYGFENSSGGNDYSNFYYGFAGAFDGVPIAFTGNLRLGFLLNNKKNK